MQFVDCVLIVTGLIAIVVWLLGLATGDWVIIVLSTFVLVVGVLSFAVGMMAVRNLVKARHQAISPID